MSDEKSLQSVLPPLRREDIIRVIEGRGCAERIPLMMHKWINPRAFEDPEIHARLLRLLNRYPQDAVFIRWRNVPVWNGPEDDPDHRWMNSPKPEDAPERGIDEDAPLSDWAMLDDVIEHFPRASYPGLLPNIPEEDGRYRIGHWWYTFFERHWQLRGMTNALMDYYTDPDRVHQLFGALTDFYLGVIDRMHDAGADAIYTTDDLGTQTGPFFSPEIFDEFYAPYYKRLFDRTHELGMHYWLHTCGDVAKFMPRFLDLGLDVIHPIQKFAMDAGDTVEKFGGKICFWAGFDVQQAIPYGSVAEVRREVREMFDTYFRSDGRLMLTLGNGATPDTPMDSLEALFEEAVSYGTSLVRAHGRSGQ